MTSLERESQNPSVLNSSKRVSHKKYRQMSEPCPES